MALCTISILMVVFAAMGTLSCHVYVSLRLCGGPGRHPLCDGPGFALHHCGCPATPSSIQNYVRELGFPGINPSKMTSDRDLRGEPNSADYSHPFGLRGYGRHAQLRSGKPGSGSRQLSVSLCVSLCEEHDYNHDQHLTDGDFAMRMPLGRCD